MGPSREDATEVGGKAGRFGKFILCGNAGDVVVWGGDSGVVGDNGAEAGGSSCGFPETGEEVEDKKSEGRIVV